MKGCSKPVEPYDPSPANGRFYTQPGKGAILSTGEAEHTPNRQKKTIEEINKEIDETKDILHHNIESVLERGQRLDQLDEQTHQLSISSNTFDQTARKTNRKMWWKNQKWTIAICVLVLVILAGVIGGAIKGSEK
ncbi:uncharacterized protein IL334_001417 [Kwoniella shivajii]|uniref:V-SNARE coiled-coil homology domain-containing protein n=1 Tax=Kwoniella shivajii TaxID=564305 RepID=A0ABZ1CS78_9TREE|nr:hypothetical protein IL334_001417 [Kwoniella shivajii]